MNPMIDEIRKYREEHAASFDYDLKRIVEDIRKHEQVLREEGWNLVSLEKQRLNTTEGQVKTSCSR